MNSPRNYQQFARADSAAATGARIVSSFVVRLTKQWYDDITLDCVAEDAGVTVQTIVRRFGGKSGLLGAAIREMIRRAGERRATPPGDLNQFVRNLVNDYEGTGDTIIRLLAVEGRHAVLQEFLTHARSKHREWIARTFADELELLNVKTRQETLDGLVIATDVYTWKMLRRDMGRSVAATRAAIIRMIRSTIAESKSAVHEGNA